MSFSNRKFAKLLGLCRKAIDRTIDKGINPADHFVENLIQLGYDELYISGWFSFFKSKIKSPPIITRKKRCRHNRLMTVKEPFNITLTPKLHNKILSISQGQRERISFTLSVLQKAQKDGIIVYGQTSKELIRFLKNENEKSKTVQKLTPKRFKEIEKKIREEGIEKFIDDYVKIGKGRTGKTIITEEDYQAFKKMYMNGAAHSIQECLKYALNGRNPQEFPNAKTFEYQVIMREGIPAIDYARKGQEFASRRWGASVPRYSAALPCENWIGDAMLFDSLVIGSSGKQTRLCLTAWMDEKSKRFVGYEIHEEGQKTEHILRALYNGIAKYRAPRDITIDNGKTYRSKTFAGGRPILKLSPEEIAEINKKISVCGMLNIERHFTIPYNHHGKDIEHEFSRLHRGFCRWFPSYFGVNVEKHPDLFRKIQIKKGKEEYLPTIEQFKTAFDKYLVEIHDTYTYESGENKGQNPISLWNAGYEQYVSETTKISPESLILLTSRITEPKTLRGNGILDTKTNTWYYSDEIIGHIGKKVYLRIPPADNSEVYCYGEKDNFLFVLHKQERIAKLIKFPEEKYKLNKQMERVNKVNKSIKGSHKILLQNIDIIPEESFARIAASNKAIALAKGLDIEEKIVKTNITTINQFDHDLAEAKKHREFGTGELLIELEHSQENNWSFYDEEDIKVS